MPQIPDGSPIRRRGTLASSAALRSGLRSLRSGVWNMDGATQLIEIPKRAVSLATDLPRAIRPAFDTE